jgi:protocatechuate 3,4-dioxygenase, beta subunit
MRQGTRKLWIAAGVLAVAAAAWGAVAALGSGKRAGEGSPASIRIAGPDEPGVPLVVTGQVLQPDGETPAPGVTLYVYQTDATGRYARLGRIPRLRGWMTTDAEGRYEYRTIRPAPYPGGRIPAHVHTQLWGGDWPKQWNRDLNFADDERVTERERRESDAAGRFAWVCAPALDADGTQRCTHDLRLKSRGDRFEENIGHGDVPAHESTEER